MTLSPLPSGYSIDQMTRSEVTALGVWAASEGWNPGLNDLQIVWDIAPESFVALRHEGALVGGGSILNYGGQFGFMGLFIMRPEHRGQGLGTALWHWRRDTLLGRLGEGASIAMDGVFEMVPFYERGGFQSAYRVLRYEGIASGKASGEVSLLTGEELDEILSFDADIACIPRKDFLRGWIGQPGAIVAGMRRDGQLAAYGVARPCQEGFKIGPLFAESHDLAGQLLGHLMHQIDGEQVQIDVPEPNAAGVGLVTDLGFRMSFGCMRLYHGPALPLPLNKIFGVTSLEFG